MRTRLALEGQLEVVKLKEAEIQANKSGEFDLLYLDTKDTPEEEESDDTEIDEPIEEESDDSAPVDDEVEVAKESIRNLNYDTVSTEDFQQLKDVTYTGIKNASQMAVKVFKGMMTIMSKLFRLIAVSTTSITKYIDRRNNSFSKLKDDISVIKRILSDNADTDVDLANSKYTNARIINSLKIGSNVDFGKNVEVLDSFVNSTINNISKQISTELSYIKHIIAYSTSGISKVPNSIMVDNSFKSSLSKRSIRGYVPDDDSVSSYAYSKIIPGDIAFISFLPNEDVSIIDDLREAYSSSKMFLGFNKDSFKEINDVNYMTTDELSSFLDKLDKLCDTCISHQKLYENIIKQKVALRYNFKNYFNYIASAGNKMSIKDSLIEYVHLKTVFIDKVYLMVAMDIHDYSATIITNGLIFAKQNVKQLT